MRNMKGLFFAFIIGAFAYAIFGKKLMGMMSKKTESTNTLVDDVNLDDDDLTTN